MIPSFITLIGVDHNEDIMVNPAHIVAIIPVSTLRGGYPPGTKCQVFCVGPVFNVKNTFDNIKALLNPLQRI